MSHRQLMAERKMPVVAGAENDEADDGAGDEVDDALEEDDLARRAAWHCRKGRRPERATPGTGPADEEGGLSEVGEEAADVEGHGDDADGGG